MAARKKPKAAPALEMAAANASQAAKHQGKTPGPALEMATQPAAAASRPDSDETPTASHQPDAAAEIATQAAAVEPGNVPKASAGSDNAALTAARAGVRDRLKKTEEWPVIIATVRDMRADPKLADMSTEHRERFIWSEMDRLYPPSQKSAICTKLPGGEPAETVETQSTHKLADNRVHGLGELPPSWPDLPPNASLAVEIGWVQAERLRIVEERPGGATLVRLERARSPAPSWSALAWLETSIRSYAKYVEVAAKVASTPGDEQAQVKRERARIADIRAVLAEMLPETGPDPAGSLGDPERISSSEKL